VKLKEKCNEENWVCGEIQTNPQLHSIVPYSSLKGNIGYNFIYTKGFLWRANPGRPGDKISGLLFIYPNKSLWLPVRVRVSVRISSSIL